ncbi:unnamed protein product [Caenorhabditis bovis]|uniref:Uncharacterized protein n=1 Tax=Caenorhabditis bovis TaxID=2654633 RepID=A0A8S1F0G4_9PELO|nr:unnamed protein product [Caenorhabditis bovis]
MSVASLPDHVKNLFPSENRAFAESITADEGRVLREVFAQHACFAECGEMIEAVAARDAQLGARLAGVLEANKKRLDGLSAEAVEYSKQIISMVTHVLCSLTVGKPVSDDEANKLHADFQKLNAADQAALKKNNPDINF